jgi:uncharacterized protein (TIGR03437 family)
VRIRPWHLAAFSLPLALTLHAATGTDVPQLAAFDDFATLTLSKWHIPGATIAISHNGRLVLSRGYGITQAPHVPAPRKRRATRNRDEYVQPDCAFRIPVLSRTTSAPDLLRLVTELDSTRPSRVPLPADLPDAIAQSIQSHDSGPIWSNYSDTDRTSAYVFRLPTTGVDAVLLFNSRPQDTAAFDADVSTAFLRAVDSIATWPTFDRFVTGPELFARDIVNAAARRPGGVAPGEIVVMFPSNAGPPEMVEWPVGSAGATRVFFDDIPAPVVYTVEGQISAIVPHQVAGKDNTSVVIEYLGVRSPPVTVPVIDTTPAFFTRNASGTGQAAMLNVTGCCNSPRNPIMRGAMAYLFATGEGLTLASKDNKFTDEKPSPVPVPVSPELKVTVGGVPATVLYAGDAGVLQINIRIPEDAPIGPAVPLELIIGKSGSPQDVTVAVRSSNLRVLVFQHEAELRQRLARILQEAGFDVATPLDELETAARVTEGPVDLLISDLAMHPDASRRMIQSIERENPQLRLMVLTPEINSGVLRAADILGAQAVVPKSASTEVLLRRVRDILKEHYVAF